MKHCSCGLIRFSGRKLKLSNTPLPLQKQIPQDKRNASLYLISPKSVHVQNSCIANIKRESTNMYSVECRRCGEKFILFENNDACFFLHVKCSPKPTRRQSDPVMYNRKYNKSLCTTDRYIVDDSIHVENDIPFCDSSRDECDIEIDSAQDTDDFNFMFSANQALVIGSYHDSLTDSTDSPSSYF